MNEKEITSFIEDIPDEVMEKMTFAMPWQHDSDSGGYTDPDNFSSSSLTRSSQATIRTLQNECWDKFHKNPQINTAVRGITGRLTGWGFEVTSGIQQIQEVIEEITEDPRNRLYTFLPKYEARYQVEGEQYLHLTCHEDGFIEIDFIDPAVIEGDGLDGCGIIFHPDKTHMPLFYNVKTKNLKGEEVTRQIPSIFIARYPEFLNLVKDTPDFKSANQKRKRGPKWRKFGGYTSFIISRDKGLLTKRATSYLRTTLEWLNHYENLKKYEIDHKKSSGSYLWVFKMTDAKTFKMWLALSDADRKKTAIAAKKTPGGSIVCPPGMEVECINPNLTSIKEQDTDILHMITSGLNEPEDVSMGTSSRPYASVKASRGPMSDRVSDEMSEFDRFFKYDFWGSIFFLKSIIVKFPETFPMQECVGFKQLKEKDDRGNPKSEPVMATIQRKPEKLIDITYPVSENIDMEARARGMMGVKHGPISESLGVPNEDVAKKMGFSGYSRLRMRKATEDVLFPELIYSVDAESLQETVEGENKKPKTDEKTKKDKEK